MKPPVDVIASAMRYTHQPSSDAAHIVKALEAAGYVIVLKAPSLDLAGSIDAHRSSLRDQVAPIFPAAVAKPGPLRRSPTGRTRR